MCIVNWFSSTHTCHCSVAQLCLTLCDPTGCSTPGLPVLTISQSLFDFMCIASVTSSSHLVLEHPLLLLPSVFPSTGHFSNELAVWARWPKYRSFSFNISPSNEYSGLISLRTDWFGVLAVQGIIRGLPPHHTLKASVLWCSAFFMVQLLTSVYDYWKNHSSAYMNHCRQSNVSVFLIFV